MKMYNIIISDIKGQHCETDIKYWEHFPETGQLRIANQWINLAGKTVRIYDHGRLVWRYRDGQVHMFPE